VSYHNDPAQKRIVDEADRVAHEIHERVRCLRDGKNLPHPVHLLEELEAELESAGRLGRRLAKIIEGEQAMAARNSGRIPKVS
jgi:hypothetical protein